MVLRNCLEGEIPGNPKDRDRACRILARTMYKELRQNGFDHKQIVAIAGELISQVTEEIRPEHADAAEDEAPLQAVAAR